MCLFQFNPTLRIRWKMSDIAWQQRRGKTKVRVTRRQLLQFPVVKRRLQATTRIIIQEDGRDHVDVMSTPLKMTLFACRRCRLLPPSPTLSDAESTVPTFTRSPRPSGHTPRSPLTAGPWRGLGLDLGHRSISSLMFNAATYRAITCGSRRTEVVSRSSR